MRTQSSVARHCGRLRSRRCDRTLRGSYGRTLDMPQRPDAMSISDNEGNTLYSGTLGTAKNTG